MISGHVPTGFLFFNGWGLGLLSRLPTTKRHYDEDGQRLSRLRIINDSGGAFVFAIFFLSWSVYISLRYFGWWRVGGLGMGCLGTGGQAWGLGWSFCFSGSNFLTGLGGGSGWGRGFHQKFWVGEGIYTGLSWDKDTGYRDYWGGVFGRHFREEDTPSTSCGGTGILVYSREGINGLNRLI
ncbi:hypothetical protein BZA05DRAFT_17263 [Tricharina praecox]|uniref:uncharacterized protein n=1 Tax=Tricharina praecox TaxID=43433 RepID=UPI0022211322|nr:uncharacterized protein BZA05DRAFT_17263 [Tricharina praecox]KAI5858921.1 hypothetical protein BZA05DRAFT_17263 [Tricharina praecox]